MQKELRVGEVSTGFKAGYQLPTEQPVVGLAANVPHGLAAVCDSKTSLYLYSCGYLYRGLVSFGGLFKLHCVSSMCRVLLKKRNL